MCAATQIYCPNFDEVFLKLSPAMRARVKAEIDRIGLHLAVSLALGIAFTYALCSIIAARRGPGAPDVTLG